MDIQNVNFSSITFSSHPDSSASDTYALSSQPTRISKDRESVQITLSGYDVDQLKLNRICAQQLTCWIRIGQSSFHDMAGNEVVAIPPVYSLALDTNHVPQSFVPDTTPPNLLSYDTNMINSSISLTFDEPMNAISLRTQGSITLQSSASFATSLQLYTLTTSVPFSSNSKIFVFSLSSTDMLYVKSMGILGSSTNTTFMSYSSSLGSDLAFSPNSLVARPSSSALKANSVTRDDQPPVMDSFAEYNQYEKSLTLVFNKPVNIANVQLQLVELVAGFNSSVRHSLSAADTRAIYSGLVATRTTVKIYLGVADIRGIKSTVVLAVDLASSAVQLAAGAFQDMYGNSILQTPIVPAVSYVPSTAGVTLLGFDFDLGYGSLVLYFDDIVQTSTLDATKLTLQSNQTGYRYTLTGGSTPSASGINVVVNMTMTDIDAIKYGQKIGTSTSNTFASIASGLLQNQQGQSVTAIPVASAKQVAQFTADNISPFVLNFSLNMNTAVVLITFSEPINITTFMPAAFSIQNSLFSPSIVVPISANSSALSSSAVYPGSVVSLAMQNSVLFTLKSLMPDIASSILLSILSAGSAASDLFGNTMTATFVSTPTLYIPDTTPPQLSSFTLSLTDESITLSFNEPINSLSVVVTTISIQASLLSATKVRLTGGTLFAAMNDTVSIRLVKADLNAIKLTLGLATSQNSTWLVCDQGLILDKSGNPSTAVMNGQAFQARQFQSDLIAPSIVGFAVDLNANTVTLTFSEPIQGTTVNPNALEFVQSNNGAGGLAYQLQSSYVLVPVNSLQSLVTLSTQDVNAIKALAPLCNSLTTCYLIAPVPGAVRDIANNSMGTFGLAQAVPISNFTSDKVDPSLQGFTADMNAGILILTFNEPINPLTVNLSLVGLQPQQYYTPLVVPLTNSFTPSPPGTRISVVLDSGVVNFLKAKQLLFTNRGNSFLDFQTGAFFDMAGNPANLLSAPLLAQTYVNDTTAPRIVGFDLNMQAGILSLNMSAVVNSSTLNASKLALQRTFSEPTAALLYLVQSTLLTSAPDIYLTIKLSTPIIKLLMEKQIAISAETSWLSAVNGSVLSMTGQKSVAVTNGINTIHVSNFTRDLISPSVLSFDYNADSSILTLHVSEIVSYNSVNTSGITFQSLVYSALDSTQLTNDSSLCRHCAGNEYAVLACESGKSICQSCDACPAGSFVTQACTATQNTVCQACAQCSASEFIQSPCSAFSDTVCQSCTAVCSMGQYISSPCTAVSNTACRHCSVCPVGKYAVGACDGTALSDVSCHDCSVCPAGKFASLLCNSTQDTTCSTCTTCAAGTWAKRTCSSSANAVCASCKVCGTNEYAASACTASSDTVCQPCTTCGQGQVTTQACSATANAQCSACTVCGTGFYAQVTCSKHSDTVCQACPVGCDTCDANNACTRCNSTTFLHDGQCVPKCPSETFTNKESNACGKCHPTCASCTSGPFSVQCLTCPSSLRFSLGSCLPRCGAQRYWTGSACAVCNASCDSCLGPTANDCTSCPAGTLQYYRTCYAPDSCPEGSFADPDNGACTLCSKNCLHCSATACLQCSNSTTLWNGKCVASCPNGLFSLAAAP